MIQYEKKIVLIDLDKYQSLIANNNKEEFMGFIRIKNDTFISNRFVTKEYIHYFVESNNEDIKIFVDAHINKKLEIENYDLRLKLKEIYKMNLWQRLFKL